MNCVTLRHYGTGNLKVTRETTIAFITHVVNLFIWQKNTGALRYHTKNKHQNIVYNCDQCKFTAKLYETLRYHKNSNHNKIFHSCDECGYLTKSTAALRYHKKSKHQSTTYNCDQCNYTAKLFDTLCYHKRTTQTKGITSVMNVTIWQKILKPFDVTTASALRYHRKSKHQSTKYDCDQCDYKAEVSQTLRYHKLERKFEN